MERGVPASGSGSTGSLAELDNLREAIRHAAEIDNKPLGLAWRRRSAMPPR